MRRLKPKDNSFKKKKLLESIEKDRNPLKKAFKKDRNTLKKG